MAEWQAGSGDVQAENLAAAFDRHVVQDPDATALIVDERRWTRGDIADLAGRASGKLIELGMRPGGRVVVQYDTSAEDLAIAIAVARAGGTLLPIPKRLGLRETNYILDRSEAIIFAHRGADGPSGLNLPEGARTMHVAAIHAVTPRIVDIAPSPADHCALIGVTSGSTGNPKGVMHGWPGIAWTAERMRRLADVKPGENILVTGAGAGAPGFTFFSYLGLAHGVGIVRASGWDPVRVLRLADEHECVWSVMVVTMLHMLLDARCEALGDRQLEHMRAFSVGGGFMTQALINRSRQELGVEVLRMYAMAEIMAHSSTLLTDSNDDRDHLDGRPGPGAEIAAVDEEGNRLSAGTVGELAMRGPSLLLGYVGDPAGKAGLMTKDGLFRSGDLGHVDPRGFVKVIGRKKDMINRGGYKIDPSEVEELIRAHPAVCRVVVVGYPDTVFGERACAVVEPYPKSALTLADMIDFLLGHGLSKEKLPERLEIREALPLSPDGKILKAVVKGEIGTDPRVIMA